MTSITLLLKFSDTFNQQYFLSILLLQLQISKNVSENHKDIKSKYHKNFATVMLKFY